MIGLLCTRPRSRFGLVWEVCSRRGRCPPGILRNEAISKRIVFGELGCTATISTIVLSGPNTNPKREF
jgi:hypothetical protein